MGLILGAAALAAAALGVGGHVDASEKNQMAQDILDDAKMSYDMQKAILELSQFQTKSALMTLGETKKDVLETSVRRFLDNYQKAVENFRNTKPYMNPNELSKFSISRQDMLELHELSDIYDTSLEDAAAGAATGALLTLAATGSLSAVTGGLTLAGSALATGEVGMAATFAGDALAVGAAATPFMAIAAPALLFTGISASMKADENLEEARKKQAEAERDVAQMEVATQLCDTITEKSEMFNKLLEQLNEIFDECTKMLEQTVQRREAQRKRFKDKLIRETDFTDDEWELLSVTRSLAGAVKSVINTPMLSNDGTITTEAEEMCDHVQVALPEFKEQVKQLKAVEPKAGYGSDMSVFSPDEEKDPLYLVKGAFGQKRKKGVKSATSTASAQPQGKMRTLRNAVLWIFCALMVQTTILMIAYGAPIWETICYVVWTVVLCPKVAPERPVWKRILMMIGVMILCVCVEVFL